MVVFQDQAMYARTLLRGAKTCKIGKKGCVFGHIDKFWKGHTGHIKKNAYKNVYLGSIFIPEKYVFRMCFESPFTRMISSLKYKWPPGALLVGLPYASLQLPLVNRENKNSRNVCLGQIRENIFP